MKALVEMWQAAGVVAPVLLVLAAALWFGLGARAWILRSPKDGKGGTAADGFLRELRRVKAEHPDDRDRVELEVLRPSRELFGAYGGLVRGVTAVAPLTGLLGTVSGMIETFDSLASMELFSAGGGGIGAGISSAMISTQMGLVVAVPGILLGAALQRRQRALEDQLEQMA